MAILQERFQKRRWKNTLHTITLVGGMLALTLAIGWLLGGPIGLGVILILFTFSMLVSGRVAPRMIFKIYKATPLDPAKAPQLYGIVEALTQRAELPSIPKLYYIPSKNSNAFAVGSERRAGIGLTDGMLRNFSARELTGVIAHEVSHIKHGDTKVMTLADTLSRLTSTISRFGMLLVFINLPLTILSSEIRMPWMLILLLVLAPTVTSLLQLGLSRTREYDADLEAARLTGDPGGLAAALNKLENMTKGGFFERIFRQGRRLPEPSLLRTHPPTRERIRRLMELKESEPELITPPKRSKRTQIPIEDWAPLESPECRWKRPAVILKQPGWHLSGLWY